MARRSPARPACRRRRAPTGASSARSAGGAGWGCRRSRRRRSPSGPRSTWPTWRSPWTGRTTAPGGAVEAAPARSRCARGARRQQRVGARVVRLGEPDGEVERRERLVGVLPRQRRRSAVPAGRRPGRGAAARRPRRGRPRSPGPGPSRRRAPAAPRRAPRSSRPGCREVGLDDRDRDPVTGVGLAPLDQSRQRRRLARTRRSPAGAAGRRPGAARPAARSSTSRPPLAHDPGLVGLVDPHRPLVAVVEGDRRLLGALTRNPSAWPRRRCAAGGARARPRRRRPSTRRHAPSARHRLGAQAVVGRDDADRVDVARRASRSAAGTVRPGRPAR